jgi:hypothetical protein
MKKIIAIIAMLTAVCVLKAQQTLYLTKSLANESVKNVEAKTSGGGITVAGGYTQDARIEVYISGNGHELSKEEIQSRLDESYELKVSVENNKLIASAKQKHNNMNWKRSLNISFKIYVPQNVSTDLGTSGGSISISNLDGNENFQTSGGSLTVSKLTGKIVGGTSGGSIDVSDSKDDIDLETSGGSIEATNCSGKIRLGTSGGSLTLKDLKGNVKATTSGGSVNGKNISGELVASTSGGNVHLYDLSATLDASTSGGNIDVELNEVGKYIKLHNSGGSISLVIPKDKGYDLDLYGKIHTSTLNNFSGTTKEKELHGKINGGGIPVTADAGDGRITLGFK